MREVDPGTLPLGVLTGGGNAVPVPSTLLSLPLMDDDDEEELDEEEDDCKMDASCFVFLTPLLALVLFENLRLFFLADEEDTLLLEEEADV